MLSSKGTIAGIVLTILAFVIGLIGIAALIVVGEAANNAITAFAAVSLPVALLAALFSWIAPQARWAIAVAMFAPVTVIAILGAWSGVVLLLGAIWTAALTCAGAYQGARARG
jgi:hypothetical protein